MKKILATTIAAVIVMSFASCAVHTQTEGDRKIVSLAASNTEILIGLGLGDDIIAADIYSADTGIDPEICTFDMQNPDIETLIALSPDVIFINEINTDGASDLYAELKKLGSEVVEINSANSIDEIKDDIAQIAEYTGTKTEGDKLIKEIDDKVEKIKGLTEGKEKKSVYYEISAAPYCYSLGNGTFINEMISLCGGENIFSQSDGWLSVTEESVIAANPQIIISTVSYDGYDYTEIYERKGWDSISAVKNKRVYAVNANASNRASQNITAAIDEIYAAINDEETE